MTAARRLLAVMLAVLGGRCASAPRPTPLSRQIGANPPAVAEGRVIDEDGHPVAGIGVRGIPRGKDIPWFPAVTTDADGRFRLPLAAPASYGFLLVWKGEVVVTPDARDPARLDVSVRPGETLSVPDLLFLRAAWERATGRHAQRNRDSSQSSD
jgi:hypothetical protein